MKYPSLSDFEPDQLRALWEAQEKGSALFRVGDFIYTILQSHRWFSVSAMNKEWLDVGSVATSPIGQHYAIEVAPEFRWQWVGTTLLHTKEALSGILSHDWSRRYSRILFLIKRWYVPTKKVSELNGTRSDKKISRWEFATLIQKLQLHVHEKLSWDSTDDISPIVFRLNYFPGKARDFVEKYDLQ